MKKIIVGFLFLVLLIVGILLFKNNDLFDIQDKIYKNTDSKDQKKWWDNSILSKEEIKKAELKEKKDEKMRGGFWSVISTMCSSKDSIEDITCSSAFSMKMSMLWSKLKRYYNEKNIEKIESILWESISNNCDNLDEQKQDVLYQKILNNQKRCFTKDLRYMKDIIKNIKQHFDKLEKVDFRKINLNYKNLFEKWYFFDVFKILLDKRLRRYDEEKEKEAQNLVLEKFSELLEKDWVSKTEFKNKLLKIVWVNNIQGLKNLINKRFDNIYKKYDLKEFGYKKDGWFKSYISLTTRAENELPKLEKKISVKEFKKDVDKLFELMTVHVFLTNQFVGRKSEAKAAYWDNWPAIENFLYINEIIRWRN